MEEKITEFIKEKNEELELGFNSYDLYHMVDAYYEILVERDLTYFDEEARNNEIFDEALKRYKEELKESKNAYKEDYKKKFSKEKAELDDAEAEYLDEAADDKIEVTNIIDRSRSSHGGYGFNEEYDDHGFDEISDDDSMKINM